MTKEERESFKKILDLAKGLTPEQIDDTMNYLIGTPKVYGKEAAQ